MSDIAINLNFAQNSSFVRSLRMIICVCMYKITELLTLGKVVVINISVLSLLEAPGAKTLPRMLLFCAICASLGHL